MPRRINMLYTSRVESCYQYLKQNTKYWKSNDKSYTLQNENLFKVIEQRWQQLSFVQYYSICLVTYAKYVKLSKHQHLLKNVILKKKYFCRLIKKA